MGYPGHSGSSQQFMMQPHGQFAFNPSLQHPSYTHMQQFTPNLSSLLQNQPQQPNASNFPFYSSMNF
jgi:hypothetical protein